MKQIRNKVIAGCCAITVAAQVSVLSAAAAAPTADAVQVLALGDDCLVSEGGVTAAEYVADFFGGTVTNRAAVGTKAQELLEDLQQDAALQHEVEAADVILLSIGLNDVVSPMLYDNPDIIDAGTYDTLDEMAGDISLGGALQLDARLSKTMPAVMETVNQTVEAVTETLYQQNPSADIVIQTVANPLAVDFKKMNVSENRQYAISELYGYLNVYLQGGTTSSGTKIATGLNGKIATLPHVAVSDFYDAFVGAPGEASLGFDLTDIADLQMTFQPLGQLVAAASYLEAGGFSSGDGDTIAAAYAAVGADQTLPQMRASLDATVQAVMAKTPSGCSLGDLNADGDINLEDAFSTIQQYSYLAASRKGTLAPDQRRAADADGDHAVTLDDGFAWLSYYAMVAAGRDVDLETFLQERGRA